MTRDFRLAPGRVRRTTLLAALLGGVVCFGPAHAQTFPSKPTTLIFLERLGLAAK